MGTWIEKFKTSFQGPGPLPACSCPPLTWELRKVRRLETLTTSGYIFLCEDIHTHVRTHAQPNFVLDVQLNPPLHYTTLRFVTFRYGNKPYTPQSYRSVPLREKSKNAQVWARRRRERRAGGPVTKRNEAETSGLGFSAPLSSICMLNLCFVSYRNNSLPNTFCTF